MSRIDRDVWRNLSGSQDNCHINNRNWDQITNINMLVKRKTLLHNFFLEFFKRVEFSLLIFRIGKCHHFDMLKQSFRTLFSSSSPSSIYLFCFHSNKEGIIENSTERIKCTKWEYDMDDMLGNTWTSEWNLVCDSENLKNVAEMFFLVGVASGGIVSGYLSDKFGRRSMLFLSVIFQTIFGKLKQQSFFC